MLRRPPLLRRIAAQALLAFAFLFAQQTAALHWLAHAVEAAQGQTDKNAPPGHHCDECLALSALGAGAAPADTAFVPAGGEQAVLAPLPPVRIAAAPRLAFRSRAPPVPV